MRDSPSQADYSVLYLVNKFCYISCTLQCKVLRNTVIKFSLSYLKFLTWYKVDLESEKLKNCMLCHQLLLLYIVELNNCTLFFVIAVFC